MARRIPNESAWATVMLGRIAATAQLTEACRERALAVEQDLYHLIETAMKGGVTNAQVLEVTDLFSSSRLYQIKHGQYEPRSTSNGAKCSHPTYIADGPRRGECTKCHKTVPTKAR